MVNCGIKKAFQILTIWPSYILLPVFSIYTFGCKTIGTQRYLVVSQRWTWINFLLTMIGVVVGNVYIYFEGIYLLSPNKYGVVILSVILFTVTLVTFTILIYCKKICCKSFIKRSGLNIETLQVVDLEEEQQRVANEIELKTLCNCQCKCNKAKIVHRQSWP